MLRKQTNGLANRFIWTHERSSDAPRTTVSEGLTALGWFDADVVVSDLAMPHEDGYALISKLRNSNLESSQVQAVALTSYVRVEDRTRALSAGFNMFVAKPVQPDELVAAIANLSEIEH